MRRLDTLQTRSDRMRLGAWRGDPTVGFLAPAPGTLPDRPTLHGALQQLAELGFRRVLTPALTFLEQQPFFDDGFTVLERLHLLRHQLGHLPAADVDGVRHRRGRSGDLTAVLDVDSRAFDTFWRFDAAGLADARSATPTHRFRVALANGNGGLVGYHVTGRAGSLGYLQRLAVDPAWNGQGVGTSLVADSLAWCRRRGCTSVLVNTQESNVRAVELYERLGFAPEPRGLAVLQRDLTDGRTGATL